MDITGHSTPDELLRRIQGEFLEMPGLRLTPAQARRFWGLDDETCAGVLETLVSTNFLMRAADGRYTRLTEGGLATPPLRMAKADMLAREISPTTHGNLPRTAASG